MNQEPKNTQVPEETKGDFESATVKSFGGYAARHRYEMKRKKKKSLALQILQSIILSILVFLSVLGSVSLFRGDFFTKENELEEKGNGTIKVPTQQELAEMAREPEKAVAEVELSVVTVELSLEDGSSRYGTGFFLSDYGHVLCSSSLWEGDPSVREIRTYTVEGSSIPAFLVGEIPDLGATVITTEDSIRSIAISVGNFSFLERGETLYAVGSANVRDFSGTVVSGIISSLNETVKVNLNGKTTSVPVLFLDAVPNESVFGAPVVDNTGSVVGFCTHSATSPFGNQLAVVSIHSLYTMVNALLGESDGV